MVLCGAYWYNGGERHSTEFIDSLCDSFIRAAVREAIETKGGNCMVGKCGIDRQKERKKRKRRGKKMNM